MNEAENINRLIKRLSLGSALAEIIVVDGGSTDNTRIIAKELGAKVITCSKPSRPKQLNKGAAYANAKLLYFVHADTLPPQNYDEQILSALKNGSQFGSFRFKFDKNEGGLAFNAYCTRFPFMIFRGGDQTLFIKKSLFQKLGGYDESHVVMEDYDIIRRGKKQVPFTLIQDDVIVSSRKYKQNSYPRVNLANFAVFSLYYCGVRPKKLLEIYMKLINHPKPEMG